jgi:enoyl-CoA hydratase/carnithine racemase
MPEAVLFDTRDGVAWLTLNRPEVLNAINLQMRDELWVLLEAIAVDDSVKAVVFRGAGDRAFSAGADLTEFGTAPSYTEARRARVERDLWGRLAHFDKPLIAAIHGFALGAGCELALLCDLRIASEDARFGLPETHLGYVPTAGGSQTLPRTAGLTRALDMVLSAEPIDAQRALDYGMLNAVVPRPDLEAAAEAFTRRLVAVPEAAMRATRRAMRDGADLPLRDAIRLERRLAMRAALA